MLPILIAIVVAIAGGTAIVLNWDEIVIALKGKRLAVLGERRVGKTHLIRFLTSGSIPEEYRQTESPNKAPPRRFQLKDLNLNVKNTLDVSGDKSAYAEWKKLVLGDPRKHWAEKADIVFYLLRADRLIAGDTDVETRVRADLRHIGSWLEERGTSRPHFFIVGTHCDLDPEFAGLSEDKIGDYADKFRKLQIVTELVLRGGGAQQVKIVLGSMKTIQGTEALVYRIFTQVTP